MKTSIILCAVVLVFASLAGAAEKLTLVRDGQPRAMIIIAKNPTDNAKVAADELQRYIEKISGAKLPIITDDAPISIAGLYVPTFIYIGASAATEKIKGLKIPSGISKNIKEEGYVIYGKDNTLVLAGNDIPPFYGTRYAVYDLLNRLGVRWFLPGEYGEVVPKMAMVTVDEMNVTERPDFTVRTFWTHSRDTMGQERELWMIRNRLNPRSAGWLGMPGDGSVSGYMPKDKLKEYPEWFALQSDGSRNPNMPCMSDDLRKNDPKFADHPTILDSFVDRVKAEAKAGQRTSAMAPEDGAPYCQCELCQQASISIDGSSSQEWFHFVNKLLEEVNKEYPDHLIATNGYSNRVTPPEIPGFNKSKNLVLMFADIGACTIHGYDDPKCWQMRQQFDWLKRWTQLCDKVWIYNYNYTMLVGKSTIVPTTRRVARDLPLLKEIGVIGFCDQDDADMSMTGIPTYVARNALEWNTKANVTAILDDFYAKWYGTAAGPMRTFYTALEDAFDQAPYHSHEDPILQLIYTPALMATLDRAIVAAEKAAATDTEKLHVRADRLIYDHLRDYVASIDDKQAGRYAAAAQRMKHMLALKEEMNTITPFFGWRPYPVYCEAWEAERMQRLEAKVNGTEGELVTLLPVAAKFHTDSYDRGMAERWMLPGLDDARWVSCRSTAGWQSQGLTDDQGRPMNSADGHAYRGVGWYRFTVDLPRSAQGKSLHLFGPALINQAWVWVNGEYVGRTRSMSPWFRPQEFDLDISSLVKAGKNQITLRVLCNDDNFGASGIFERMFIYAKK